MPADPFTELHKKLPTRSEARTGLAACWLKLRGASFDDIADALGLPSAKAARDQCMTALADKAWHDTAGRDMLRKEAGARIELIMMATMPKATDPDDPDQLGAAKVTLALIDRLCRLYGLDAPTELVVYNPSQAELENWVAGMTAGDAAHLAALEARVVDDDETPELPVAVLADD